MLRTTTADDTPSSHDAIKLCEQCHLPAGPEDGTSQRNPTKTRRFPTETGTTPDSHCPPDWSKVGIGWLLALLNKRRFQGGAYVRSKGSLGLRRARRSSCSEAGLHHQFPRRDRQGSSHLPFWRFGVPLCDVPSWWVSLVPCSGVPRTSTIKRFFFSAFAFVWRTCWTNVE